jgi:hypothetical protein
MKKIYLLYFLLLLSSIALCQQSPNEKSSGEDSLCIKRKMAFYAKINADGKNAKYYKDEEFIILISKSSSSKNKLGVLNIGASKNLTVTIQEVHVEATDSAKNTSLIRIDTPSVIFKEQVVNRCGTFAIDLKDFQSPNDKSFLKATIKFLRVELSYSKRKVIAELGSKE